MELMERIRLLQEYGMMDETAFEDILTIIKLFKEEYGIELTEKNAGIMITHMSSAFHRNVTGEEIDAMDAGIVEEIKQVPEYAKAGQILVSIVSGIKNNLSKKEMEYFLVHICNLLANTN
ncbi:PRD domain-containing protein [Anaerocolumna xylanovorans]|uniref:PRD domain-containing protein n=1 Tax=Anaerocolumna xylanovorans DSM 12503 TaxID=1121345 RepID=A0A1M7XY37_9FIRM|nr:PRD domain-containing protein [Anaerocolumna xylanovorans]SHO43917.1 PRD domain-containing protein [Anaerocolumna xylanovorans DSM 12503]